MDSSVRGDFYAAITQTAPRNAVPNMELCVEGVVFFDDVFGQT
jgi:hypothetical protein